METLLVLTIAALAAAYLLWRAFKPRRPLEGDCDTPSQSACAGCAQSACALRMITSVSSEGIAAADPATHEDGDPPHDDASATTRENR